jgi:TonB-linked SusC/RagA family outer membrane protein
MKQNLQRLSRLLLTLVIVFAFCGKLFAQNLPVRGIVLDNNNQPVQGVSINIKGTSTGTVTGVGGRFTISADKGQTLVFKSIGFITQEVAVNDTDISIQLVADTKALNEVVITALGVKKEVQKLGYSQTEIKGSDLIVGRDANPLNSLAGKVSGLSIGSSAEFFGSPTVVLRGSKDILYVVDGQPVNSDTYDFSPDDVETIDVLKGPNAAALYGFRGINGAIIINTKKGTKDKKGWQVDFNSTNEIEKGFIVLPKSQAEYGRGTGFKYSYGDVLYDNKQRLPEWGPRFEGQPVKQFDSPYDPVTGIRTATPWLARGANNFENFVQTGITSANNLAVAASGYNYDMRMSYSHTFQQGIFPNTKLNLDNFNISAGYDINPKLRVEGDLTYNVQYSPNIPDVSYGPNSYSYMFKVYGSADYNINDLKDIYKGPQGVPDLVQYAPEYGRENSAWFIAKKWLHGRDKSTVYGSLKFTYKFTKELNLSLRTQIDNYNELNTEQVPASTNLNTYLPWYYFGWYGDYREDRRNSLENNTDLLLNYNKTLNSGWSFGGLLGASERSFRYISSWATTKDLSLPGVYNLNNSINPVLSYNFNSKMQVYSAFYSFDIGYKNYFNINTTNRLDHLSTLPTANNTYYFPSVSISSVVTDYLKLPEFISFAKLRVSYADSKGGLTAPYIGSAYSALTGSSVGNLLGYGSEHFTPYNGPTYGNFAGVTPTTIYNGTPSVNITNTIANPAIKPYDVKSTEAGIDLKFLHNRLGLDFTYFTTTNGPNIFSLPVAPSTTYTNQIVNGVTTLKKGFEIGLQGSILRNPNGLNWDVNINYSTYKETLKSIFGTEVQLQQNGHNYVVGDRLDAIYGTKFVRDQQGNIVYGNGSGVPLQSGGGIAQNGLLGYANPDFAFGISNRFSYKGFTLSFQFDGRIGGKIYDRTYYQSMNGGTALESASGAYGTARLADWNAFKATGKVGNAGLGSYVGNGVIITGGTPHFTNGQIDNMSQLTFGPNVTPVTAQSYISSGVGGNFDEYYMISRSYAKLREASLGYTLPSKLLAGSFIKKATFSIVGRNLLYFAARKDMDLDQYASGYNASDRSLIGGSSSVDLQSQTARRYGFNINLSF